jgi:hypothetical protein
MGSDFSHVGLGSPNLNALHLLLTGQVVGVPNSATSEVVFFRADGAPGDPASIVAADGISKGYVVVRLRDVGTNTVAGKTVTLAANPGSQAVITPPSGVSTVDNGAVVFTVTNLTPETVTFAATDTTDGVVLDQKPSITFGVPPAAGAGINVFPNTVAADGVSTASITVTLRDTLNRPTPGKLVNIAQGGGRSIVSGPAPPLTDANGEIRFTVASNFNETVTYSAIDISDGNLPAHGSGAVTFDNSTGNGCGIAPSAAEGFQITPFATGFVAHAFNYGGVNFPCGGPSKPAFDAAGQLFVADTPTGTLYRFGSTGGQADAAHVLNATPLNPGIASVAIGPDGRLYATQAATTGNFFTGAVVEIDPVTGALVRTVAPNITCAHGLAFDPLSGDLFTDDGCAGGGSDNASIWRIANPASLTPTVSVYATTPNVPNAPLAFAPDGTLFVWSGGNLLRIGGTNTPQPAVITPLPGVPFTGLGRRGAVGVHDHRQQPRRGRCDHQSGQRQPHRHQRPLRRPGRHDARAGRLHLRLVRRQCAAPDRPRRHLRLYQHGDGADAEPDAHQRHAESGAGQRADVHGDPAFRQYRGGHANYFLGRRGQPANQAGTDGRQRPVDVRLHRREGGG